MTLCWTLHMFARGQKQSGLRGQPLVFTDSLSAPLVTSQSADSQSGMLWHFPGKRSDETQANDGRGAQRRAADANYGLGIESNYPTRRDPLKKKKKKPGWMYKCTEGIPHVERLSSSWRSPLSHLPLQQDQATRTLTRPTAAATWSPHPNPNQPPLQQSARAGQSGCKTQSAWGQHGEGGDFYWFTCVSATQPTSLQLRR